ncbi:MAG: Holliday junction branch migration protein RuvA [Patescibacteria group bacterium]|nr:Holliday junction branch migration protein RuvA [Patescibacteria group bacterium]MDD5715865.1 Holliday junction branch migration protein RuvA [Patescibacteria group bacterium]
MIARIEGTIQVIAERSVIVDVHGVGYRVYSTPAFLGKLKIAGTVILHTHEYVREDIHDLYGFGAVEELSFFEQLIGVTGIGPKTALTIMSLAPVGELKRAIAQGDTALLTKVSGIGRKTAERLVLELRGKVGEGITVDGEAVSGATADSDVIDALTGLGYTGRQARHAVRSIDQRIANVEDRLKAALKILGKKH